VTVKDENGSVISSTKKYYEVYDLYMKKQRTTLRFWDVFVTAHFDKGLKPLQSDRNLMLIPIPKDTKTVKVEVSLNLIYGTEKPIVLKKKEKKVEF
jgi:hypothetical protein